MTEVYSTELKPNGQEEHTLLARLYRENREWVDLQDIPKDLINATVSIEDREFFKHNGIDPKGIARAFFANLRAHRVSQGGSTITQQLVKSVWLSPERTMARKLKELTLAMQVEKSFTKEEIIEMYLNEVCYGHGAFGVRAASKMYFGTEPKQLTLEQCVLLAGLPRRPTYYSPVRYPDHAKARREQVAEAMADMKFITRAKAQEIAKSPLNVEKNVQEQGFASFRAPYFTHMVVRQLCDQYGVKMVYEGGLRVYTSLDMRIQKCAEEETTKWIEDFRHEHMVADSLKGQAALACMAPQTGDVIAMVGGVGPYEKVQYNRAYPGPPYYGRQPGSSFKPYVWSAALESGYGPNSVVSTEGINVKQASGESWSPKGGHGSYSLREALAQSVNRVSVKLLMNIGAPKVANYAARMMNVDEVRLRPVPSLALGTSEVAPLEMATGFSCFPTGGLRPTPRFIRRITDINGNILVETQPQFERVIQAPTAVSMVKMMEGVVDHGTGTRAHISGWPCAGKTGTAQDARDTWFVGYTPDLCAAIWIGNDDHTPLSGGAFGGTFCAPLWGRFMSRAMKIYPLHAKFPTGEGATGDKSDDERASDSGGKTVTLCRESGGLATAFCPSTYEKTLATGERMPGPCRIHTAATAGKTGNRNVDTGGGGGGETVTVCAESGRLATPNCPNTVERTFPPGKAPTGYCTIHGGGGRHSGGGEKAGSKGGGEKAGAGGEKAGGKAGGDEPPPVDEND
jgi:penicillin-binding protein 1A